MRKYILEHKQKFSEQIGITLDDIYGEHKAKLNEKLSIQ